MWGCSHLNILSRSKERLRLRFLPLYTWLGPKQASNVPKKQIKSDIRTDQVKSDQMRSSHIKSGQIRSNQIKSCQIRSNEIKSDQIRRDQVRSNQAWSSQIKSDQIKSGQIQIRSHQIRSVYIVRRPEIWKNVKTTRNNFFQLFVAFSDFLEYLNFKNRMHLRDNDSQ